jgi:hypothetical protein
LSGRGSIIQQKSKEAKAPLPFKTIVGSVSRGHPLPHHGVSYPPVPPRHQEQTTPNRTLKLVAPPPPPPPQMAVVKPTATKRVIDVEPDFDTLFEQLLIYKKGEAFLLTTVLLVCAFVPLNLL